MKITRKLIITNTLWSAVAQVGVMAINLLVLPLFIKNLGAELYGIWVLSGVVLGYLNVFDFGFTQGLQKYVAEARIKKDDRELSEVVVTGTGLLLAIGLLLGGIFWFGAPSIVEFFNIQPENQLIATRLLQISALFCVVMWPLRIVDVVLNAGMKIKELSFLNAFKTGAQSLVMLGMVSAAVDVVLIKWVTTGVIAGCSIYGLVLIRKYVPEISWRPIYFKLHQLHRMHKFSLGMFYIAVLGLLTTQIDTLIIGKFVGMVAVTAYSVASKLYQLIQRVTGMLMAAVTPAVYNLHACADMVRIEKLVYSAVRFRMLITAPAAYIGILIAPDFIRIWVGEEFVQYAIWAQLLCVVPLFTGLGVANTVSRSMGRVKEANIIYTAQILLNFGISLWLVHSFGVGGPILGTVIAVLVVGDFTMFPFFCRLIGISWKKTFFMASRIGLGGAVVFLIGRLLMPFVDVSTFLDLLILAGGLGVLYALAFGGLFMRNDILKIYRQLRVKAEG
jgi:O-antigen/teichoic acid export membrane protein